MLDGPAPHPGQAIPALVLRDALHVPSLVRHAALIWHLGLKTTSPLGVEGVVVSFKPGSSTASPTKYVGKTSLGFVRRPSPQNRTQTSSCESWDPMRSHEDLRLHGSLWDRSNLLDSLSINLDLLLNRIADAKWHKPFWWSVWYQYSWNQRTTFLRYESPSQSYLVNQVTHLGDS